MKKCFYLIAFLTFVMLIPLSFAFATEIDRVFPSVVLELEKQTGQKRNRTQSALPEIEIPEFKLPASLEVIEEEAFEGTAIVRVEVPESVSMIGDRAFANVKTLRSIRITIHTNQISASAFEGSNGVTICAPPGSYAKAWARANGIPYSPVASYTANSQGTIHVDATSAERGMVVADSSNVPITERQQRYKEVKTVSVIDLIINEIQGRGPPMA